MRTAIKRHDALHAPSVGTWHPAVHRGAPVQAGDVLGKLRRAGTWLVITAPKGTSGSVVGGAQAGAWLSYDDVLVRLGDAAVGAVLADEVERDASVPEGVLVVRADTDGTIYLRPEPGTPAFAAQGAAVKAKAPLALVEVMKTFTPVRASCDGIVERVCVDDSEAVEAGAPLFWIRPDA